MNSSATNCSKDFRNYLIFLINEGRIEKSTINSRNGAIRFFLVVILGKNINYMFRGKFLAALKSMDLDFCGSAEQYEDPRDFLNLIDRCYNKEWVAYCKPPFRDSSGVIHYLGRYTHRVAISNNRILNVRNGQVTFKWRDYSDGRKEKS